MEAGAVVRFASLIFSVMVSRSKFSQMLFANRTFQIHSKILDLISSKINQILILSQEAAFTLEQDKLIATDFILKEGASAVSIYGSDLYFASECQVFKTIQGNRGIGEEVCLTTSPVTALAVNGNILAVGQTDGWIQIADMESTLRAA